MEKTMETALDALESQKNRLVSQMETMVRLMDRQNEWFKEEELREEERRRERKSEEERKRLEKRREEDEREEGQIDEVQILERNDDVGHAPDASVDDGAAE